MNTPLDPAAREALLAHARSAIGRAIGVPPTVPDHDRHSAIPHLRAGAFVTVRRHGELRGCIGYLEADRPLADVVAQCAVAAATADPRFPPLTGEDWADAILEISLLGPLEPAGGPAEVEIGRHGLVVESGRHRGLLLPQVAVEWRWDAAEFAAQTCVKAGLPRDAWRGGARLFRFEAEVFGERAGS